MKDLTLFLITWNQELATTSKSDIDPILSYLGIHKPDLVVIALQEAAPCKGKIAIGARNYVGGLIQKHIKRPRYEFLGQASFGASPSRNSFSRERPIRSSRSCGGPTARPTSAPSDFTSTTTRPSPRRVWSAPC